MKALVTGATGFTGFNLTKTLIGKRRQVRVLVRPNSNYSELKKLDAEIVFGDITDPGIVKKVVDGVDIVFHIAALFRKAGLPDKAYWDVNVNGTRNLLTACLLAKPKKIIHCSTIGVHGHVTEPPANEDSPFNPGDIYQLTKLEGEKLAIDYHKKYNLPIVVIRPAGIYGPGDMRFLKLFHAIAKRRFIMIGKGNTLWHPVYIDDLIQGFLLAAEKDNISGEVFIIGGPEYLTLNALTERIADILGVTPQRIHIPALPAQLLGDICEFICTPFRIEPPIYRRRVDFFTKTRAFDITKAKKILGYNPRFDIDTGLRLTAEWYKERGLLPNVHRVGGH